MINNWSGHYYSVQESTTHSRSSQGKNLSDLKLFFKCGIRWKRMWFKCDGDNVIWMFEPV